MYTIIYILLIKKNMAKAKLKLLNPRYIEQSYLIIIGEAEKSLMRELLTACKQTNAEEHYLDSKQTMLLHCLCAKFN